MNLQIRPEQKEDHRSVFELITHAFAAEAYSDQTEQFLVERLRKSEAFIPELSLVGEYGGELRGYILLSRIHILAHKKQIPSLALAPVAVHPDYQGVGLGGQLIRHAHNSATRLGHRSVILLGHPGYYPRFGYRPLHEFNLELPFDAPPEACMALELVKGSLAEVSGKVIYPAAFFEEV